MDKQFNVKKIAMMVFLAIIFLMGDLIISSSNSNDINIIHFSWFIIMLGFIHVSFSDTVAYLYSLNPIGPRVSSKTNKLVGSILLFIGLVLAILIVKRSP